MHKSSVIDPMTNSPRMIDVYFGSRGFYWLLEVTTTDWAINVELLAGTFTNIYFACGYAFCLIELTSLKTQIEYVVFKAFKEDSYRFFLWVVHAIILTLCSYENKAPKVKLEATQEVAEIC